MKTPHTSEVHKAVSLLDNSVVQTVYRTILHRIMSGSFLFIAGNGACASLADHFALSFMKDCFTDKGIVYSTNAKPRAASLASNFSLISAWGNDVAYEDIFAWQLKCISNKGDTFLALSGSGNSGSIIKALYQAKSSDVLSIGFAGQTGGKLKELADYCIHVPSMDMGACEDVFSILLHDLVKYLKEVLCTKHEIQTLGSDPGNKGETK